MTGNGSIPHAAPAPHVPHAPAVPHVRAASIAVPLTGPVAVRLDPDVGDPIVAELSPEDAVIVLSTLARRVRDMFGPGVMCLAFEPLRADLAREAEARKGTG